MAAVSAPAPAAVEVISGTVDALVVEDRVQNKTTGFYALKKDDGSVVLLAGTVAQTLQDGARVEIQGQRNGAQFMVEQVHALSTLSAPEAAAKVASLVQRFGTLAIAHADDFDTATSQWLYQLHEDAGRVTTLNVGLLPSLLRGGMRVMVSGELGADPSSLHPKRITILAPAGGANAKSGLPQKSTTVNSILLILANFNDTAAPAFTPAQAQQVMTSNASSVANYYNEVSYGTQTLNVTVTSTWVTMNMSMPATCDWQNIGTAANAAALAANPAYNANNYHDVVYLFPNVASCGWAGLAWVGAPGAWINGTGVFRTNIIAHEMGHNFGLLHAGSLNCNGVVIGGGNCSVAEYGDPFDTMGNQHPSHFNAVQKSSILGWIAPSGVKTHTSGSTNYTLTPIESAGGALYAVQIPTVNANRTYWIEYRQPIGFDGPALAGFSFPSNGAQIRVSFPFEWTAGSDDTELLDMTPGTVGNFTDAALLVGQSFLDSTNNINIIVTAATANALTVNVTTSSGTATTTTLTSSANPSMVGSSVTFTASVTGSSPTGVVNFTDGGSTIAGCATVALGGAGNTRTAACPTNALPSGLHSIVAAYGGDANNSGSSSAGYSQTVKSNTTTGIGSSLTPSTVGTSVTFTATVTGAFPTGTVNFKDGAASIANCSAAPLSGAGNIRSATCATSSLGVGSHSITATYGGDSINNGSTSVIFTQVVNSGGGGGSVNVALAGNGGVASASSTFVPVFGFTFPVASVNDGDRTGINWGHGGGWANATANVFPDWVQINFNGQKTIDHVIVYTLQDNFATPVDPPNNMTFTLYGVTAFQVQGWNGAAWVNLGAAVAGNNLVKRTVNFAAFTTNMIRVNVTAGLANYARIVEIEAWTAAAGGPTPTTTTMVSSHNPSTVGQSVTFTATVTGNAPTGTVNFTDGASSIASCAVSPLSGGGGSPTAVCTTSSLTAATHSIVATYSGDANNQGSASAPLSQVVNASGLTNVALAANGGVASASSTFNSVPGYTFPVASVNDGDRTGLNFGHGGGWASATANVFPDWVQITFNGQKTISQVIVYTLQDNFVTPVDPPNNMTFTLYGVTAFQVQGWNGAAWVNLGAAVAGNNLVKVPVNFAAFTTNMIRVNVTAGLANYARIIEIEAWGN